MPRHPGGRPSDLTPQVIEDVRRLLPTVMYLETVADYLGCERTTWRKWLARGRKEFNRLARNSRAKPKAKEALYLEFFNTYKTALAEGELFDLGVIKKASTDQVNAEGELTRKGEWQAAAWRAERRFPQKWGRKDRVEVTGKKGGPVELDDVNLRKLPPDELIRVHRATLGLPPAGGTDAPDPGP